MAPSEALHFVRTRYECQELKENLLKLTFFLDTESPQIVFVEVSEHFVVFRAPFAEAPYVAPIDALKRARRYLAGIEMQGDNYLVIHIAPLTNLNSDAIDEGVALVATIGHKLQLDLPAPENQT